MEHPMQATIALFREVYFLLDNLKYDGAEVFNRLPAEEATQLLVGLETLEACMGDETFIESPVQLAISVLNMLQSLPTIATYLGISDTTLSNNSVVRFQLENAQAIEVVEVGRQFRTHLKNTVPEVAEALHMTLTVPQRDPSVWQTWLQKIGLAPKQQ